MVHIDQYLNFNSFITFAFDYFDPCISLLDFVNYSSCHSCLNLQAANYLNYLLCWRKDQTSANSHALLPASTAVASALLASSLHSSETISFPCQLFYIYDFYHFLPVLYLSRP